MLFGTFHVLASWWGAPLKLNLIGKKAIFIEFLIILPKLHWMLAKPTSSSKKGVGSSSKIKQCRPCGNCFLYSEAQWEPWEPLDETNIGSNAGKGLLKSWRWCLYYFLCHSVLTGCSAGPSNVNLSLEFSIFRWTPHFTAQTSTRVPGNTNCPA